MPNFFFTFSFVHFWSIEGGYFLQNANNLNFKLFFGCIHDPQSKYSAFILEEFWIISHFECRLKLCRNDFQRQGGRICVKAQRALSEKFTLGQKF